VSDCFNKNAKKCLKFIRSLAADGTLSHQPLRLRSSADSESHCRHECPSTKFNSGFVKLMMSEQYLRY